MKNIINIIVKDSENGSRIDSFISKKEKMISRTRIKNLILQKNLKLNNLVITSPSRKVVSGDKIDLIIPEAKKSSLKPYNFRIDIKYEDQDLLVLNKPAGIIMHPGAGNYENTIVNALIDHCGKSLSNIGGELRPGIVHRIDKDTSGLVVIAKNNSAHEKLSNQFSDHSIERVYELLVWGKLRPQTGRIETLITRSSKNRQLMEVGITKGKKAITNYNTLELFENNKIPTFSLVECKLETGRTHQIRVHMSHKGNYILGDRKYNKKFKKFKNIDQNLEKLLFNLNRQFLHAKMLGFIHPRSGKKLKFSSILPNELMIILKTLKSLKNK